MVQCTGMQTHRNIQLIWSSIRSADPNPHFWLNLAQKVLIHIGGTYIGVIELHPILEAVKSELPTPLDHIYARTFVYQMVLRSSCHGYVHNSYRVIFMRSWSVHTLGGHGWDGKPSPPQYDTWD